MNNSLFTTLLICFNILRNCLLRHLLLEVELRKLWSWLMKKDSIMLICLIRKMEELKSRRRIVRKKRFSRRKLIIEWLILMIISSLRLIEKRKEIIFKKKRKICIFFFFIFKKCVCLKEQIFKNKAKIK